MHAHQRQKKAKFSFSIKTKLLVAFLVILLIPSISIGYSSYLNAKTKVKEKIQLSAEENVKIIDKFLTSYLKPKVVDVGFFSDKLDKTAFKLQNIHKTINSLKQYTMLHPEIASIYTGSDKGDFLLYPQSDIPASYDARKLEWYKSAMSKKGTTIITDPHKNIFTGKMVITFARTLNDGSGVIAIDVNTDTLKNVTSGIKIGKKGYPAIFSSNGDYLVHPTEKPGTKATGSWVQPLIDKQSGKTVYEFNGQNKEMYFTTNKLSGLKIIGSMYLSEIDQDTNPILKTTLLIVSIFILIGLIAAYFLVQLITRPLNHLVKVTESVSNGDLTESFIVKNNDEIGKLGSSFNSMISSLKEVILQVREKAELLATSSQQLLASSELNSRATDQVAAAIQEVASGTEKQTSMVNETNCVIKEVSTEIEQVMRQSQTITETATNAASIVKNGRDRIHLSTKQMENIHETVNNLSLVIQKLEGRSNEINQIIDVISDIAGQTNLLALNAAIEAARAGEQGKGFAVVAAEVRKLAEQSSHSTENIRQLISSIQTDTNQAVLSMNKGTSEVEKGIDLVRDAGEAFLQIQQFVDHVTSEFQKVYISIQGTVDGTEQIVEIMSGIEEIATKTTSESHDVSTNTEEQSASMEEIAVSASSLADMAEELKDSIKKFNI